LDVVVFDVLLNLNNVKKTLLKALKNSKSAL